MHDYELIQPEKGKSEKRKSGEKIGKASTGSGQADGECRSCDLSITGLLRACRNPRPEVSAAAERLLERVRPKKVKSQKGQSKVVPPPSVPVPDPERPEHKGRS